MKWSNCTKIRIVLVGVVAAIVLGGGVRAQAGEESLESMRARMGGTRTRKTDMPTARNIMAVITVDGKIYVMGGGRQITHEDVNLVPMAGLMDYLLTNTFLGFDAGYSLGPFGNPNSTYNTFLGYRTGYYNDVGNHNTFIGGDAGYYNETGSNNTFLGNHAGHSNDTGNYNTFIGNSAGFSNYKGHRNTFLGNEAGYSNKTGYHNTFIGGGAGYWNTTGYRNTFLGFGAGCYNTKGDFNIFLGYNAGRNNDTGDYNIFLGNYAGYSNETGYRNTFLGNNAGSSNTTGYFNTFLGNYAGEQNETGYRNTFLGNEAGRYSDTGSYNTFLGDHAGCFNTGTGNVFIGYKAGYDETGSNKLYIANSDSFFEPPLIYGEFDTGKVGIRTAYPGSYTFVVNGSAAKSGGSSWDTFSDMKLKEIQGDYEGGLSEVCMLNPVCYKYREDNKLELPADKEFVGLTAQDVQDIIPEAVEENDNGYLMVNNDPIIWAMVNAIKELRTENEALKLRLRDLERRIEQREFTVDKDVQ